MSNPVVLIVEDDVRQADIYSLILKRAEFNTQVAHDVSAALEQIALSNPDLVIVDLHMPRLSGASILEYIHNNETLEQPKLLLITADRERAKQLKEQVDAVLLKPFSIIELQKTAQSLQLAHRSN